MSDIQHSDYCPVNNTGDIEDCPTCLAEQKRIAAYWKARYYKEQPLSREEVMDAYSDAAEYQKRERLLNCLDAQN